MILESFGLAGLSGKLLRIHLPLTVVAVLAVFTVLEVDFYRSERAKLIEDLVYTADGQRAAIEAAVWDFDIQTVKKLLDEQSRLPFLQSAQVFDDAGKVLASVGKPDLPPRAPELRIDRSLQHKTRAGTDTIGRYVLTVHDDGIRAAMLQHLMVNGAILLVLMTTLIIGTIYGVRAVIGRPLEEFRRFIGQSPEEQFANPLQSARRDELGDVLRAYSEMLVARHNAENAMRQREDDLSAAVTQIRQVNAEVTRFNHLAVDRELRMVELKDRINQLLDEQGKPPQFVPAERPDGTLGETETETSVVAPDDLAQLLDLKQLQALLENFCNSVGIASAIIDLQGKVLAAARWQRACTDFHRANKSTCARCIESDTGLAMDLQEGTRFSIYRCKNGLTDAASPIIIGDQHVANVFVGQFHLNAPDMAFFINQAKTFGFDENDYLSAIGEVPVVPEEKLPDILGFLAGFSQLVASLSFERAKAERTGSSLKEERAAAMNLAEDAEAARAEVAAYKDNLEVLVEERTQELRDSEETTRLLLESVGEGVFGVDLEGQVSFVNPQALMMLGYGADEILGQKIHALIHHTRPDGTHYPITECPMWRSYTDGTAARIDDEILWRKDGTNFPVEYNSTPILRGTELMGAVISFSDITERKAAERIISNAMGLINESIAYASRIQRSVLPDVSTLEAAFDDHLVIWSPKDIVGGDIYLHRRCENGHLLILIDCTGHGVPGAFMTMIATGAFDQALLEQSDGDPAALLKRTNHLVKTVLSQDRDEGESDDGFDCGVCRIDDRTGDVVYAGARFELWRLDGHEIEVTKGDKVGIGYRRTAIEQSFTNHVLPFSEGAAYYLASDGLVDQIGGDKRRAFGKRRLKGIILDYSRMAMAAQATHILRAFEEYQHNEERRDDISLVGFKPKT